MLSRHASVAAGLRRRRGRGFTIIELMVTLTVFGVLLAAGMPAFGTWIKNTRVRTTAQQLQDGIRLAHAEAGRRNRQTVFSLTNQAPSATSTATANGLRWAVHAVPLTASNGETLEFVQGGNLADPNGDVTITGPAAICFNSAGRRQTTNAAPGVSGADCTVNASSTLIAYNIAASGGNRPLRVTVALGGQLRVCDPARTLSATAPDGC